MPGNNQSQGFDTMRFVHPGSLLVIFYGNCLGVEAGVLFMCVHPRPPNRIVNISYRFYPMSKAVIDCACWYSFHM